MSLKKISSKYLEEMPGEDGATVNRIELILGYVATDKITEVAYCQIR